MALVVGDLWCLDSFVPISIIKFSQINDVTGVTRDQPHNTPLQMSHGVRTICVDSILFHFFLVWQFFGARSLLNVRSQFPLGAEMKRTFHILALFLSGVRWLEGVVTITITAAHKVFPTRKKKFQRYFGSTLFLSLVNVAKLTLTSLFFSLMMMMIFFVVLCLSLERVCRDFFFPWKTHTSGKGRMFAPDWLGPRPNQWPRQMARRRGYIYRTDPYTHQSRLLPSTTSTTTTNTHTVGRSISLFGKE